MTTLYTYGEGKDSEITDKDGPPEEQRLEGHRAMLCHISIEAPPTKAGFEPTRVSAYFLRKGTDVAKPAMSVLPPLFRIPASYKLPEDEKGFHLEFICLSLLPASSGITDSKLLQRIYQKAIEIAPDAKMTDVSPTFIKIHKFEGGNIRHTVELWKYNFWSSNGFFSIYKNDPGAIEYDTKGSQTEPAMWFDPKNLNDYKVDIDVAILMAELAGAKPIDSSNIQLKPLRIDNQTKGVWLLPYELASQPLGFLADTGEMVVQANKNSGWQLKKGAVIWNR